MGWGRVVSVGKLGIATPTYMQWYNAYDADGQTVMHIVSIDFKGPKRKKCGKLGPWFEISKLRYDNPFWKLEKIQAYIWNFRLTPKE